MSTYSKLLLAALAALTMMAFAVGTATANRFAIDDQDIDAIWNDESQRLRFEALGNTIACEVTLLGSFHSSTIVKSLGTLVASITHATVDSRGCTGGIGSALTTTLPWNLRYGGFVGRLPTIERVILNLINGQFLIEVPGLAACLALTTVAEPGVGTASRNTANGQITGLAASGSIDVADLAGSVFCDDLIDNGEFSGTASVRDLDGRLVFLSLV